MIRSLHLALACAVSIGFAAPHLAQIGIRLNGPLPHGIEGDVFTDQFDRLTISPDSAWVVYRADGDTDQRLELYSVPTAGGPVRKISAPLESQEQVQGYAITADSSRVVYLAYTSAHPLSPLYSVPIDGSSEAVELAPSFPGIGIFAVDQASTKVIFSTGTDIAVVPVDGSSAPTILADSGIGAPNPLAPHFALSPDGSRAVYMAVAGFARELFSQPSDGSSPPVRLHGPLDDDQDVMGFRIHPAGTQVVFVVDQDTAGVFELYAAPIDGGAAPVKLHGPLVAGGDVGGPLGSSFALNPAGTRVVYLADQESDGRNELYSSDLVSAASNVKLNGALVAGGNVMSFTITPSGGRVLYRANQITVSDFGVFNAPIDGSMGPTTVYAPAGDIAVTWLTSSDETVIVVDTLTSGSRSLQRVPFFGGPAVRLNPTNLNLNFGAELLPDASRVLFRANVPPVSGGMEQLYSVPMDGSQVVTQLNPPVVLSEVKRYAVAPDGSRAIYLADQNENNRDELFSVPPDGSAPAVKLNEPLATTPRPEGDVKEFLITADSAHAVYQADGDEVGAPELYSVSITGSQPPIKLNAPLIIGGGVYFDFLLTSDSQRVMYRANQDGPNAELYSVPLDRSTAPIKLTGPMVAGGDVSYPFYMTPDETRLLYQADQSESGVRELFSTPTDGSAAPTRLHAPLNEVQDVFEWMLSADGARAIFSANLDADDTVELYSAPIDGSSSPLRLNGAMTPGGDLFLGLRMGAVRVVYAADQETNDVTELYSVPVDGSGPALKLNGSLVVNGDVVASAISNGTVLYLADQTTDEIFELYGVPVDGSSPAVRLNGTLVGARDVTEATVSPNGQWVAYRADQLGNDHFELFGAPTDGSSAAVRVSPPTTADVFSGFKFTPDSVRVLLQDSVAGETNLYSAPIDGSAPALRLNPVLAKGREVRMFNVDAFSRVLYVADQNAINRFELFRVPSDGSETARRVNRPFGFGPGIASPGLNRSFAYTPAGNAVLYIADQEVDGVFELFATFFDWDKKHRAPTPTSLVGHEALEASEGHDRKALPPIDTQDDLRRAVQFTLSGASLSYFENGSGVPRGSSVLRSHEELAGLGIHPALQDCTDGITYAR